MGVRGRSHSPDWKAEHAVCPHSRPGTRRIISQISHLTLARQEGRSADRSAGRSAAWFFADRSAVRLFFACRSAVRRLFADRSAVRWFFADRSAAGFSVCPSACSRAPLRRAAPDRGTWRLATL
jgi:hypothetical protein